ncbi:uncharacterized protein LOC132758745 [Ruditapes philippinarum]|uniref:uncharacterized protein LOC132758745 n=1 Tax=Ruditapes philippinarum TaxID=129788 RepID=UPI00295B737B|nr:uncharacterized protein LOC132758745 [Ruditapes philippinarum]
MKVTRGGQQWHLSWAEYIEQCFISKCNPITNEDVINKPNQLYDLAESSTWTRLTQSIELYEYNEFNNTMIHITYGYIKRQGEHITLNFTQDGSLAKRALFETSTPSASTVSPAETRTEESNPKEAKQIYQNVGVSVGISVTVISVVASIIIIVILKRRGKIQMKCLRKAESKCSAYISKELHPDFKNDKYAYEMSLCSPYDQIDDLGLPSERCSDNEGTDNVISGHTYLTFEKHTWESNTDDNIGKNTKTETSNVYNTLNSIGNNNGSNESGKTKNVRNS